MNLNREQIMEKIQNIKKQEAELGVTIHLNPDDILDNKQLAMFYGGCIGSIDYGKYVISIIASGDIRANLYDDGCNVCYVKDRSNSASFAHETQYLIKDDAELKYLSVYCSPDDEIINTTSKVLFIEDENWLETAVYVFNNDKLFYCGVSTGYGMCNNVLESNDVLKAFVGISGYIEAILGFEKEETEQAALASQNGIDQFIA